MNKDKLIKLLKNKNNLIICLILIIGIVLMAVGGKDKPEDINSKAEVQDLTEEERLEQILSQIDGAGEVSVMITYYSSTEKNIAYETKTSSRSTEESEDKKAVMTDGEPMVVKEVYPDVKGVIVTAQGAGRADIQAEISEAVSAALNVPAHKICIFKKEE